MKLAIVYKAFILLVGDIFANIASHNTVQSTPDPGLLYMQAWKEGVQATAPLNTTAGLTKLDFLTWQPLELRQRLGTSPMPGRNNFFITHGFNIKYAVGAAIDESYCIMTKPSPDHPIGGQECPIANKLNFTFSSGSHRFDYVTRFSPESFQKMKQCRAMQNAVQSDPASVPGYWNADSDGNMEITKIEYQSWLVKNCPQLSNVSIFLNTLFEAMDSFEPALLGKSLRGDGKLSIGHFWHMNWGWRERVQTEGNLQFPWRNIVADDIPETITAYADEHVLENALINRACAGHIDDDMQTKYTIVLRSPAVSGAWTYNEWKTLVGEKCLNDRIGSECLLHALHENVRLSGGINFKGPPNTYFPIGAPQMRESNNFPGSEDEMPYPVMDDLDVPYDRKWSQARLALHMVCDGHVTVDDVMKAGFRSKSKPVCFERLVFSSAVMLTHLTTSLLVFIGVSCYFYAFCCQ